jgi:hypothetical protein
VSGDIGSGSAGNPIGFERDREGNGERSEESED